MLSVKAREAADTIFKVFGHTTPTQYDSVCMSFVRLDHHDE